MIRRGFRYARVDDSTRDGKLQKLDSISGFEGVSWLECSSDWQAPFRPLGVGDFFGWPKLTDIFPLHTAGSVFYRTWPIAESRDVLISRWETLIGAGFEDRRALFRESRDRKIGHVVNNPHVPGYGQPSIRDAVAPATPPLCTRYGYRSFDRQHALFDYRLGDYLRPGLHYLASERQVFFVSPDSIVPAKGPLVVASAYIPDQHFFCGRGGKDVIPLYRDREAREPNITAGLLDILALSMVSHSHLTTWLPMRMLFWRGSRTRDVFGMSLRRRVPVCLLPRMARSLLALCVWAVG